MTLDTELWLQAGVALAAVLLLAWLAARVLRATPLAARAGRRLAVQEVLALDQRRRLILLRCDGREMLLLTGGTEDRVLLRLPPGSAEGAG